MSTIKVDTLQTRAGTTAAVTGAGFVATDQIRGNTAANSVTVVAEGGTNTTNLQQGLTKSWSNVVGNGTAISDSFNLTSLTDNATGSFTKTIANDMASINYSVSGMIAPLSSQSDEGLGRCMNIDHGTAMTASAYRVHCVTTSNGSTKVGIEDNEDTMTQVVGDLA